MMKRSEQNKECKDKIKTAKHARTEIPDIVNELVSTCNKGGCFDHVSAEPIPYREAIIDILRRSARILYPGYFIRTRLDQTNLEYYLGQEVTAFYEILSDLGGQTVVGARSVIGGNVWLTHSVPPDTEVFIEKQDLIFGEKKFKKQAVKKNFS